MRQLPDISLNVYHARVVSGATWLDATRPGWEWKIDLDSLDLESPCRCILGQLWGEFHVVLKSVFIAIGEPVALAEAWGFTLLGEKPVGWDLLQDAWVYETLSRREKGN